MSSRLIGRRNCRRRLADLAEALGQAVQEQRDALVGLAPHQHFHVVVVAVEAVADHAQQLLLQARQLRGDLGELVERHVADVGAGQRHGLAAMRAFAEGIEADQFAGQVEADDLLLAVLADADRLEGAIAGHVHRRQRIADAEQALAALDGATSAHDLVQALPGPSAPMPAGRQSCCSEHCAQLRRSRARSRSTASFIAGHCRMARRRAANASHLPGRIKSERRPKPPFAPHSKRRPLAGPAPPRRAIVGSRRNRTVPAPA